MTWVEDVKGSINVDDPCSLLRFKFNEDQTEIEDCLKGAAGIDLTWGDSSV